MCFSTPESNRRIGWGSAALGGITGLILGMWSFDGPVPTPAFLGDYADTSRRLARLGHIAFFGLGILNLLTASELERGRIVGSSARLISRTMNFGNVFLPLTLFAASAFRPAKYLMSVPATSVTVALVVLAWGVWRDHSPTPSSASGEPR